MTQHEVTVEGTATAVRYALGLLDDQGGGRVLDPLDRLPEVAPAVAGLEVAQREAQVVVTSGDLVTVRLATAARAGSRRVSWHETHVVRVAAGEVVEVWAEFPSHRIAALAAGRPLRWPGPRALASTRTAAAVVRGLARLGGPAGDPADVVRRYVQEFKNAQRFSVFPRLFGPGFRHHFGFPGRGDGFESFMSVGRDLLSSFADVHVDVEALIAEGELVVERNRVTAVHRRPFAGVAPTGRAVGWTETHLYRVRGGRIVENWPAVDVERLVADLGTPR